MTEMKNLNMAFDALDKMLKSINVDSSILRELDSDGDNIIGLSLAYIFESAKMTEEIDPMRLRNQAEFIYSRRLIMSNIFMTLARDIHKKFGSYIVKKFIDTIPNTNSNYDEDDDLFGSHFRNVSFGNCINIGYNNNNVYTLDTCNIASYASNYICRGNIYDIAYASTLNYYYKLISRPYCKERIRSINFNGILVSYVKILDILGAIATVIYSATMFPEININLMNKRNIIDNSQIM